MTNYLGLSSAAAAVRVVLPFDGDLLLFQIRNHLHSQ
jgi:hypothetical protein